MGSMTSVRNRITLFSHTSSPSSQPRRVHQSCPAPSASLYSTPVGKERRRGGLPGTGTYPPQAPAFAVRGVRIRPPILLAEALHVNQRGGQVRLISPVPHGRRASL